jgi:LysR family hydrogen peroxide-inducible transcriptional activator
MHCLGQQISAFCAAKRIHRNIVCRTTQLSTVLGLVGLGLGVSLVPEMAARDDAGDARRYIKVRQGGPTREIALAWRTGRSRSGAAEAFAAVARLRPWLSSAG